MVSDLILLSTLNQNILLRLVNGCYLIFEAISMAYLFDKPRTQQSKWDFI